MRLVSFLQRGAARYGVVEGDGVVDLTQRLGAEYPSLRAFIAGNGRTKIERVLGRGRADHALSELSFLPAVPDPAKIICIGANHRGHRAEMRRPPEDYPALSIRWPSSIVGHGHPLIKPRESAQFDFEGEIALIIGKAGRRIPRERALEHVMGFSCFQDGTVRDFQRHSAQFTAGKNFACSGALGPVIVTREDITDPSSLTVTTRLNGVPMQEGSASDLIFGFDALVAYCSTLTELCPGDVIATGTPGGVGAARNPPVFMKPGDTVEVEIGELGLLRNPVSEG